MDLGGSIERSFALITSQFNNSQIIEYFIEQFDTYKSYNGVIYHFNGMHWTKGDDQCIVQDIDQMSLVLERVIAFGFQGDDLNRYTKHVKSLRSVKRKKILIKGIIRYVETDTDLWDINPDLIGFRNGVYDLLHNIFRIGHRDDYITMVNDYDYIPSRDDDLNDVDTYFNKIMPVQEERELLCLLLSTMFSNRPINQLVLCIGDGSNGKDTTFTYLMRKVLGPYYYNYPPTTITRSAKTTRNELNKVRAIVMSEPNYDSTIKTTRVKNLVDTGHSLFMLCNEKPRLDRKYLDIRDGVIVIPFRSTFKTSEWMSTHGLNEGDNHTYQANETVKSDEYADHMRIHLFNYLVPYYNKFKSDGYNICRI